MMTEEEKAERRRKRKEMQERAKKRQSYYLEKVRSERNLTQQQVADLLEVPPETYQKWERGQVFLRVVEIIKICKTLHFSFDDIFGHL